MNKQDTSKKLTLIRNLEVDGFEPDRVRSTLLIEEKFRDTIYIPILENRRYIFPEGTYTLRYEESPHFKQKLWEFYGIEGRSEIKFHVGKRKEHSKGCPLTTLHGIQLLHSRLNSNSSYQITVKNI